jgi:MFS family permease
MADEEKDLQTKLEDTENDIEKPSDDSSELDIDLEAWGEEHGYVLDVEVLKTITPKWRNYQLANDGKTVLIPQPSSDPNDSLTWSWRTKHTILFVIAATAFLPDYGSATGAVTLIPQSVEWGLSQDYVNHSQVGNVFMLGAGGVVVVALAAYFGRLPVLFWFTFTAVWTAAGCAGSATFEAFMAFRILNGFFSTVAQGGGLMFIKDLFFVHERSRKINIWASFVILSPYFGPLLTAFITATQIWQWAFGVYTIMTGLCLLAQILFGEETYYNRKVPMEERPGRIPGFSGKMKRLIGIEQWRTRKQRSTFGQAVMRPVLVLIKPTVFLSTVYYLLTFAWVVGINTTLSIFVTPLYNFGLKQIGYFYFTPIVAAILGEIAGHWLHDAIATSLTHRSKEKKLEPEYRLMAIAISTPFIITGLVVLGFALENAWHYMIAALAWGMYVFGIMITTVAITSYCLDSYPEGSGEVAAWINFARTTGGFIVSYFQVTWANAMGTKKSFGIQAAICVFAYLIIVFLQIYGRRLRERSGPLRFKTD